MGARGPVPAHERRRRNAPTVPQTSAPGAVTVEVPEPNPSWHPAARDWFLSLERSGQSRFYEPSDYATAVIGAEILSRILTGQWKQTGALLGVWHSIGAALLCTEGARRRVGLILERPRPELPDDVSRLEEMRRRRGH